MEPPERASRRASSFSRSSSPAATLEDAATNHEDTNTAQPRQIQLLSYAFVFTIPPSVLEERAHRFIEIEDVELGAHRVRGVDRKHRNPEIDHLHVVVR